MAFDCKSKGASSGTVFSKIGLGMAELKVVPSCGTSCPDSVGSQGSSFVPSSVAEVRVDIVEMLSDSDTDCESLMTVNEGVGVAGSEQRLRWLSAGGSKNGLPMLKRSGVEDSQDTLVEGAWEEELTRRLLELCERKNSLSDKQRDFFLESKAVFTSACVMVVASVVEEFGEGAQSGVVERVDADRSLKVKKGIDEAWSNLKKKEAESFGPFSRVRAPRILFGLVCEMYKLRFDSVLCVDSVEEGVDDDGGDLDSKEAALPSDQKEIALPRMSSLNGLVPRDRASSSVSGSQLPPVVAAPGSLGSAVVQVAVRSSPRARQRSASCGAALPVAQPPPGPVAGHGAALPAIPQPPPAAALPVAQPPPAAAASLVAQPPPEAGQRGRGAALPVAQPPPAAAGQGVGSAAPEPEVGFSIGSMKRQVFLSNLDDSIKRVITEMIEEVARLRSKVNWLNQISSREMANGQAQNAVLKDLITEVSVLKEGLSNDVVCIGERPVVGSQMQPRSELKGQFINANGECFFKAVGIIIDMDVRGVKDLIVELVSAFGEKKFNDIMMDAGCPVEMKSYVNCLREESYFGGDRELFIMDDFLKGKKVRILLASLAKTKEGVSYLAAGNCFGEQGGEAVSACLLNVKMSRGDQFRSNHFDLIKGKNKRVKVFEVAGEGLERLITCHKELHAKCVAMQEERWKTREREALRDCAAAKNLDRVNSSLKNKGAVDGAAGNVNRVVGKQKQALASKSKAAQAPKAAKGGSAGKSVLSAQSIGKGVGSYADKVRGSSFSGGIAAVHGSRVVNSGVELVQKRAQPGGGVEASKGSAEPFDFVIHGIHTEMKSFEVERTISSLVGAKVDSVVKFGSSVTRGVKLAGSRPPLARAELIREISGVLNRVHGWRSEPYKVVDRHASAASAKLSSVDERWKVVSRSKPRGKGSSVGVCFMFRRDGFCPFGDQCIFSHDRRL